jgi:hypothetical protein
MNKKRKVLCARSFPNSPEKIDYGKKGEVKRFQKRLRAFEERSRKTQLMVG